MGIGDLDSGAKEKVEATVSGISEEVNQRVAE